MYKTGKAAATYALDASASAALVGFDSILSLSGTLGVRVNTTGVAVGETVDVNGTLVNIVFSAAQGNVQGFSGSVGLSIAGFVTLSGEFAFEKVLTTRRPRSWLVRRTLMLSSVRQTRAWACR